MPVCLLIHADDFGLTPGINRAIVELYQAGVLRSASLMSTAPAAEDAVRQSAACAGLGVGCHLTLVDGAPAAAPAAVRSLLGPEGRLLPTPRHFVWALARGTIQLRHVEAECVAQIRRLRAMGVTVTHVDTHKHLHALPAVARAVLRAARTCGVTAVRVPFEPAWSRKVSSAPWQRRLEVAVLARWAPRFRSLAELTKFQRTAGTLGIAATGTLDAPVLRRTLQALLAHPMGAVWELCCHPGHVDPALEQVKTRLRASREVEWDALRTVIPEFLTARGSRSAIRLIHYGELAASSSTHT